MEIDSASFILAYLIIKRESNTNIYKQALISGFFIATQDFTCDIFVIYNENYYETKKFKTAH